MIGPHVIKPTAPALRWASRAKIVKQLDGVEALNAAPPDAIRVFRRYFPNQDLNALSPEDAVNAIVSALGGYRHPLLYVELLNEVYTRRGHGLEQYVEWTKRAVYLLHQHGLKVAGFSFSTGTPEPDDWAYLRQVGFAGVDAIAIHEYWGDQGFSTWNALRYRRAHEWTGGQHPPFIITECGRDAVEGGGRGWKRSNISAERYIEELAAYNAEIEKDRYVLGAVVFTAGATPDWWDFDLDPIMDAVIARLTPASGPPPSPPPPGGGSPPQAPAPPPPAAGGGSLEDRIRTLEQQTLLLTEAWRRFRQGKFEGAEGIDAIIVALQGGKPLDFTPTYPPPERRVPSGWQPQVIQAPNPSVAGVFKRTPKGVIIHGSRSGQRWSALDEFRATMRYAMRGADGKGWHATIGPGVVAIHMKPNEWGWHAGESSKEYLGVEVAQARLGDPISDDTVLALAWYILNVLKKHWPDLPEEFPMHSEVPQGRRDGKTDLYPPGPEADAFRERLRRALDELRR